ncbi:c-type cytochrome [Cohnella hashimotonis]|uniref:Cytochrome c n=1 Tax=Cohnella hashimotonis TaxID=2826895 RepID=A0ABT6TN65_9BACL|nr:cytochrome c [Cohnella hashimotonis]MDI4648302.1 cytochrome c [Cohnella hashimotonis]
MKKYAFARRGLRIAAASALIGALLLTAACGKGKTEENAKPSLPAGPAETIALYRSNCISCHGGGLEGTMGPDTDLRSVGARLTEVQIAAQITNGGQLMPALKDRLTSQEIDKIAAWLAALH